MVHSRGATAAVCVKNQPGVAFNMFFQNEHMTAPYGHHVPTWRGAGKLEPGRGQKETADRLAEQMNRGAASTECAARATCGMADNLCLNRIWEKKPTNGNQHYGRAMHRNLVPRNSQNG
jgi:hypothetical protein